ncbi:MAG: phenylalanine--tRNA ligase subunit beta [Minisyncoccia bacterium]|jgi:phenylalanyl-tRNA synthetase beta chain
MKFSYFWLKDLINFKQSPDKLANLLTLFFAETNISFVNKRPILEVDLLPNRFVDGSSHLGLAREIGAILNKKFNYPQIKVKEGKEDIKDYLIVNNKSKNCRLYTSRVIFNVEVKPSPKWVQERLIDCGLRPINNVVDATNYIMLLTGQPLHVFDFDKVSSNKLNKKEIIIRQAQDNETITTLDNKTYNLTKNVLLICDSNKPLAIAGIKGGVSAEVTPQTRRIIIESANFDPYNIRQTSRAINLRTDASVRFEHDIPFELTFYALELVSNLIQELAGGEILKGVIATRKEKLKKIGFKISESECQKFLGINISLKEIKNKLDLLGFQIKKEKKKEKSIFITTPFIRNDLKIKEDIIGEIGRLIGFNNIKPQRIIAELKIPEKNDIWDFTNKLTDWMKTFGFTEVKNYSLISLKDKNYYSNQDKIIDLSNPLSENFSSIRADLLIGLFHNIELNYRFFDEVKIFEIGNVYNWENDKIKENILLSSVWAQKKNNKEEELYYCAKGIIETLFNVLNIQEKDYEIQKIKNGYRIVLIKNKDKEIGRLFYLDDETKKNFSLEGSIVAFTFNVLMLKLITGKIQYRELPLYPPVLRDISLVIDKKTSIGEIIKNIKGVSSLLESLELFDVYEGKNIPNNKKSLSFHLIFRSSSKTLSSKEVDEEITKIITILQQLGAEIR